MDSESKSTIKFLQTIAGVHEALCEFANQLRERPEVTIATVHCFTPKKEYFGEFNSDGSFISYSGGVFGVSAELNNGFTIDWWLELGWNENNWRLNYNVHSNDWDGDGSHISIAFSELKPTSLNAFVEQLNDAVEELVKTANDDTLFTNSKG